MNSRIRILKWRLAKNNPDIILLNEEEMLSA